MADFCCSGCQYQAYPYDPWPCLFCLDPYPDEEEFREMTQAEFDDFEERHLAYQLYMAGY